MGPDAGRSAGVHERLLFPGREHALHGASGGFLRPVHPGGTVPGMGGGKPALLWLFRTVEVFRRHVLGHRRPGAGKNHFRCRRRPAHRHHGGPFAFWPRCGADVPVQPAGSGWLADDGGRSARSGRCLALLPGAHGGEPPVDFLSERCRRHPGAPAGE